MRKWVLIVGTFLLLAILACKGGEPPKPQATATPTPWVPHVGGQVFGVECQPVIQQILHGELAEVVVSDVAGMNRMTYFKLGSVRSSDDSDVSEVDVVQRPAGDEDGWSTLPGVIVVDSNAIDGPPRTVTYYIDVLVGNMRNGYHVIGGNLWCQVDVLHEEVIPTVVVTVTSLPPVATATLEPTREYPEVVTKDGSTVIYSGSIRVSVGGTLETSFVVIAADGSPALGSFLATLGDPPSDPRATHAGGELSNGKITLSLPVNWPVGVTKLYFSYGGEVYEMTEIEIVE